MGGDGAMSAADRRRPARMSRYAEERNRIPPAFNPVYNELASQQTELVLNGQMDTLGGPTGSGKQLAVFEAAARYRSIRVAAALLDMTTRDVSRSLRELEASMSTRLFTRHHGTLGLARAGKILLLAVSDEAREFDDAVSRVVLRQVV